MKARINYKSRKTIIITCVIAVLLIAAVTGTVAFIKGNNNAAAAMPDDNEQVNLNNGNSNNGDTPQENDNQNNGENVEPNLNGDQNNGTTNNGANNSNTTNQNTNNGTTTAGTTTGTTTTGNNGANVPNQDYTQTTVIPGRDNVLVEQNTKIGWSPISVAAYIATANLNIHKPNLELQKYAYLDGDSLEELPINTAVQKGETITYVIKITNKGNEDANGIRTIDSIPEGTELASISEGGELNNDGKIVWKNDIKAGETVTVSFKVVVTADSVNLIRNTAKVNGEETPETKTPVITANKTAQIVTIVDKEEVLENRDAKVGETIRYTITAKNTSEVAGTTVIKDSIPDGTTFVDGSITENGNFDKENGTITWNNVVVPAKGEASVSFDVIVNEKTTAGEVVKSVSNTATVGNTPTEEVETKVANITGEKFADKTEAKVGDTLTYTIKLTNSGNGDGKVTVTDEIPAGTTLVEKSITNNGVESNGTITWTDVEVKAGDTVEVSFKVTINNDTKTSVRNTAVIDDNKPTEEVETKVANITGAKSVDKSTAKVGDALTYTIKLTNSGNGDGTVTVTDEVPTGTTLVADSITANGSYNEVNKTITWTDVKVEAGDTVEVSFKVTINNDTKTSVRNTAVIDDNKPTEEVETKVANITGAKSVDKSTAKVGDALTYTIKLTNSGNGDGTVTVTDEVPTGTTLVADSITANGSYNEENKTITWTDVEVKAGKTAEVSFKVTINNDTTKSVTNKAIIDGNKPTEEVETKVANITTVKTSTGKHADGTPVTDENPLHELDKITYTLTATNNGNGKGTVKISDTIPEGTTLVADSIKIGNDTYTESQLNEGIDVTLEAGEEKKITFTVTINPFKDAKITVRNADAKQDGTEVPPTEDEVTKEYVSIDVNKKFVDKDNIDKYRPGEVTVGLYSSKDSKEFITTIKLNESNGWKGSFTGLNKYDLETKALIDYDVREINVDKNYNDTYTSAKEGDKVTFDITNTLKYENVKTSVTAKKIWDDNDGKVGARESVTFELYKNGEPTGITQIASDAEDVNWTVTFQDLQKYEADGTKIEYTVVEVTRLPHYAEPVYGNDGNVLTVTNKIDYTTFTKDVSVKKIWVDPANTEHEDITINLYQSGNNEIFRTATLDKNTTSYTFTALPKYDKDGNEYTYTAQEVGVKGYTTSYSEDKLTITNTIEQNNKVEVSGTKTWVDPEGTKHDPITIRLYQNDNIEAYRTIILENGVTNYKFENLPKYKTDPDGKYELDANGNVQLNKYTVREDAVEGYNTTYSKNNPNDIINTIEQNNEVSISGTKIWKDPEGTVHDPITIKLLRDGEETEKTFVLKNGETEYSFKNLEKYDLSDGHEYNYTVREDAVEGYDTTYSQDNKLQIINTIKQVKKNISGTKTWIDPEGSSHPEVLIDLYRNTELYQTKKLENDKYEFTDLDTYDSNGNEYNYEVKEREVSGYTSEPTKTENGVNFTNTIKQAKTSISGTKTWVDPEGTLHSDITIILLRDGTPTGDTTILTNGTTTYSFENLDKYDLTDGHEYQYTVQELDVTKLGYTSKLNGNNFTNTIIEKNDVNVSGTKTWIVPEGTKYPTITIRLIKNGTKTDNKEVLENGKTSYSFTNLPRYQVDENGNYILDENGNVKLNVYTVEEDNVEGYNTTYSKDNPNDIINTIKQNNEVSISGTKTWVDPEGTTLVHPDITIKLLKNGTKIDETTLTNGNTKYEFTGLPRYKVDENGKYALKNGYVQLNEYTIEEVAVKNYDTTYDGYNITNTFNQEIKGTVEITTTTTSQTSVKTPLDVVFVLDVSGSMNENNKDKTMVDSVNTAISTIMNENPESRIGVVAYSSTYNSSLANANNATTLLPLGKYTPKTTGKYLTLQENVLRGNNKTYDTITTNVNEKKNQTLNVYGGTYTQAGIKEGADILTSANTKFTTTVNGKEKEITRTPVMILLSDGDPTYYNEYYETLSEKRNGNGSDTTENEAYYTIRTANYYKQQITSHYYGTTGTKSKFYTIGLNMSGTLSETILNPTSANVNKCNDEGTEGGYFTWRNVKGKLYDKIIADGSAGKYSYADKSYVGSMTTNDLQSIFNTIINDNSTSTETRDITVEESDARRVNLEGIDTSKAFNLTIGSHSYNFAQATSNGYVKGNETDGYYVDLSNLAKGTTISISYNK